ncbi:hypothetical protein CFK39_05760 [Brachybacterium avium]|uniref:Uncharacterized protein n=1 Tax=Brachybacterium avium TaxID=2017485 RepID=A0A220UBL1_9MICO|nr:hypothetical protein [Brachybacterium avium]ASK65420.1 hypothetical protein CFK39_05760 [Brachybacterium avium]
MTTPGTPSVPSAAPAPVSDGPRLRPLALTVAVLATADVLVSIVRSPSLLPTGASEVAELAVQAFVLASTVVSVLLAIAVILLVQRATSRDGRTPLPALLALGLLTLALLLDPLWTAFSAFLVPTFGSVGGSSTSVQLLALGTHGLDLLCTLALGLLALLLGIRGTAAPRTGRAHARPLHLALALCILAVVAAVLLPVNLVSGRFLISGSSVVAALAAVPGLLAGIAHVLLVPIGGLLIARTMGASRWLTWAVLAALWTSAIAANLFIRLLIVQLTLGAGPEVFSLWNGLSVAVQVIAALAILVLAVLVLVRVRRPRQAGVEAGPTA